MKLSAMVYALRSYRPPIGQSGSVKMERPKLPAPQLAGSVPLSDLCGVILHK